MDKALVSRLKFRVKTEWAPDHTEFPERVREAIRRQYKEIAELFRLNEGLDEYKESKDGKISTYFSITQNFSKDSL